MTGSQSPVFVVDDDDLARAVLTLRLADAGFAVADFASAHDLLAALEPDAKGCVITDVRMSPIDGVALTVMLRDQSPGIDVIVITGYADIPLAVSAMKAGARDFIQKSDDFAPLIAAIHELGSRPLAAALNAPEQEAILRRMEALTPRELEVLTEIGVGKTGREIGQVLGISARTVEAHRRAIMLKMEASRLGHLVRMAALVAR